MTDNPFRTCAVLWDMDGTLLDSHHHHWRAWEEAARLHRFPMTYAVFNETFGQRNDLILRRILGEDLPDADVARLGEAKEVLYRLRVREDGVELLPGVRPWLDWLATAGWRQAIASSAPPENVDALLSVLGIASYFAAVVHAGDVKRGKPDPEVYLLAADRLGVLPERCVVIEDAMAGVEGARRAGMRCIGVGPLYAEMEADITVRSLANLPPESLVRLLDP